MSTYDYDYDFIGFRFGDYHSIRDLKIYRTSDGSRYNENLVPTMTDKSAETPGGDGMYFFGTYHKQRQFSINFAFDSLEETDLRKLRKAFAGKEICELSFDERPYVVYNAKVTGTPQIKTICFDEDGKRIYKGEGSVQFTCYYPYGHTPNKLYDTNGQLVVADGRSLNSYNTDYYPTKAEWAAASGLGTSISVGVNPGDVPAPFVFTSTTSTVNAGTVLRVGSFSIQVLETCSGLTWDSKTGIVKGTVNGELRPISYSGNGCVALPVSETSVTVSGGTIDYEYWYY